MHAYADGRAPGLARVQDLGVEAHFHKIEMKPGKPLFFGTRGSTLVFGLPGNPVSSLVCFELFVRPAIRALLGHAVPGPCMVHAVIALKLALNASGQLTVEGTLRYQACDDRMCYIPQTLPVKWTLQYEAFDRQRAPAAIQHR